jgi:hypothetical protein
MQPINFELRDVEKTMRTLMLTVAIAALELSTFCGGRRPDRHVQTHQQQRRSSKPVRFWTRVHTGRSVPAILQCRCRATLNLFQPLLLHYPG